MGRRNVKNRKDVASAHAKTAEPIELPFRMVSDVGPRNRVLDGCAHWRYMENTVERLCAAAMNASTTRGGDAAYSQAILATLLCVVVVTWKSTGRQLRSMQLASLTSYFCFTRMKLHQPTAILRTQVPMVDKKYFCNVKKE